MARKVIFASFSPTPSLNNIRHLKLINSSCLSKGCSQSKSTFSQIWKLVISDSQLLVTLCHLNTVTLIKMFGGLGKTTIAALLAFSSSLSRMSQGWTRDSGSIPQDSTLRKLSYFLILFPTFRVVSTALLFPSLFSFPCKEG